jgi:DNA polymerase delta subunit 3
MPALKRGGSAGSGIMQAFGKAAAAKAKKAETAQPTTPSGDDSSMHPLSDDGEDDTEMVPKPTVREGPARKSKKEREEDLRRMMEEEEDEGEEADEKADTEIEEPVEEPPAEEAEPEREEPSEIVSVGGDGRRRGRRRVMRKKQILDDQGYLGAISAFVDSITYVLTDGDK